MKEREKAVSLHGNPFTLLGEEVETGEKAPAFKVLDNDLQEVDQEILHGRVSAIVSVPSLDTPVCDREVRRFNEEAAKLANSVQVLTISMDLPFAQKRWCGAAGIEQVKTLSDHRDFNFGKNWGLAIKELRLLARSVYIVDKEGQVVYREIVSELGDEPNYEEALSVLKKLSQ